MLEDGKVIQDPQKGEPTLAPMLEKEEAFLRPKDLTATQLHNRVRGLACGPKPKIPFTLNSKTEWIQVLQTQIAPLENQWKNAPCGSVLAVERGKGILVKCKESVLWLCMLQPAGKKPMGADAFANGRALKINEQVFTENG